MSRREFLRIAAAGGLVLPAALQGAAEAATKTTKKSGAKATTTTKKTAATAAPTTNTAAPTTAAPTTKPVPAKLKQMVVQLSTAASAQQIGEFVAFERGYYKAAGLDVKLELAGPTTSAFALVGAGAATVGLGAMPALIAARTSNQKVPIRAIANELQQAPLAFFSKKSSNIQGIPDFKLRKIGAQAGPAQLILAALLKQGGLTINDVDVVTVGFDNAPLTQGQVAVMSRFVTDVGFIQAVGEPLNVIEVGKAGLKYPANMWVASEETIAKDPQMLAAFLDATAQGWKEVYTNEATVRDVLPTYVPALNMKNALEEIRLLKPFMYNDNTAANGWGAFDDGVFASSFATFAPAGSTVGFNDIATRSVLALAKNRLVP